MRLETDNNRYLRPKIEEIKARCEAATEGPWFPCGSRYTYISRDLSNIEIEDIAVVCDHFRNDEQIELNKLFIAHARQDIPDLLKYIDELEGKLKFYREYADCQEGCRSRSDSWVKKCSCGFVEKEKQFRESF